MGLISCITLSIITLLLSEQVFSQDAGTAGSPRGQHCRGFNAEEIREFYLKTTFFNKTIF